MQDSFYYQEELSILRELAGEFSRQYPAIAPMLAATGSDPDVERILEGTAYLSSFVKQRLDDEFPEIIQGMLQHIFPHYLRPIPSAALVRFNHSGASMRLNRGVLLNSIPVEDAVCPFTTTVALDLVPLNLDNVRLQRHGEGRATLSFAFSSPAPLSELELDSLSIYVSGPYAEAAETHRFVLDRVRRTSVRAGTRGEAHVFPEGSFSTGGFGDDEALLPWPANSFRGYRLIQEYFTLPEKFLFWRLDGFKDWRNRGQGNAFTLDFRLDNVPERAAEFRSDAFMLNVIPAVNIFPHGSEPIRLDHHRREYPVMPEGYNRNQCMVYSIRRVASRNPADNSVRIYQPIEKTLMGQPDVPVYAVYRRQSEDGRQTATTLSVAWPGFKLPRGEVMSIDLLCTNADLPALLRVGDVATGSDTVPKNISFSNITAPTAMMHIPSARGVLWRLLSHFNANLATLANTEALKKLLGLYIFPNSRDRQRIQANRRKIESIAEFSASPATRLFRGVPLRGQRTRLALNGEGFACNGDLRIFADVLEHCFAEYASMNCFVETTVEETGSGQTWNGVPLLGANKLL